jgi:hypothetical protein
MEQRDRFGIFRLKDLLLDIRIMILDSLHDTPLFDAPALFVLRAIEVLYKGVYILLILPLSWKQTAGVLEWRRNPQNLDQWRWLYQRNHFLRRVAVLCVTATR